MRDLIYSVDKWTAYLWKSLVKESAVVRDQVDRGGKKLPTFPSFAREVFARLYSPPKLCAKTRPEDEWAKTLHDALDELPTFKKLAAYCARNKEFASAATANLLERGEPDHARSLAARALAVARKAGDADAQAVAEALLAEIDRLDL